MNPERIKEALTRKIGPLPLWAWGAIALGGLLIYRYKQASELGVTDANAGYDGAVDYPSYFDYGPGEGGSAGSDGGSAGSDPYYNDAGLGNPLDPSDNGTGNAGDTYNITVNKTKNVTRLADNQKKGSKNGSQWKNPQASQLRNRIGNKPTVSGKPPKKSTGSSTKIRRAQGQSYTGVQLGPYRPKGPTYGTKSTKAQIPPKKVSASRGLPLR